MIKEINYQKCTACSYPIDLALDTFIVDLDAPITGKVERSPCQTGCPAGVNIPGFIYMLRQGRPEQAISLLREALPLPAITGHVCFHPCETVCARNEVDEALNINALERFTADYWLEEKAPTFPKLHEHRVAIAGSGPAGLSAAYYMAKLGYPVTVFEAMPATGGMLRYGIPEYRLPRDILDAQIKYIGDTGVDFETGVKIGKDITLAALKDKGYRAFFLATGATRNLKPGIPGEGLKGVMHGLDFLRDVNTGKKVELGRKVVVIGGGNVALDAARTALRLGDRDISIFYRRSRKEMPAHGRDIEAAKAEGVKIRFQTVPVRILSKDGRLAGLECVKTELGEPDASGRRTPKPVKGSEFIIEADTVIAAAGEAPDTDILNASGFRLTRRKTLKVDSITLETGVPGIFAGGDMVNGPSSVVEAIASGRQTAVSIDRFLKGENIGAGRETVPGTVKSYPVEGVVKKPRQATPLLPLSQRQSSFSEVNLGFTDETALREAERCMACGIKGHCTEVCPMDVLRMDEFIHKPVIRYPEDCMTCYNCELTCPMGAIDVDPIKKQIPLIIDSASGA